MKTPGLFFFALSLACSAVLVPFPGSGSARAAGGGENGFMIAENGRPAATIVIDKEANRAARFAAGELRHHLELITGARLPVVTDEAETAGRLILVGESALTREMGLYNKDFEHQEYLVRFLPDKLVIMGRDREDKRPIDYDSEVPDEGELATCYGVYDFLERFCGVRWYLPTGLGLVYPEKSTLAVRGDDVRRAPAMKYRELYRASAMPADLSDYPGPLLPERERKLFMLRWRLADIEPYACNHAFYGYLRSRRHLEEHRDWFASGYDDDLPENPDFAALRRHYPNMCYTNEEFIADVVRRARDFFDTGRLDGVGFAAGDYFSLGPMDSSGRDRMCLCERCAPLIHEEPPCNAWRDHYFFWDDRNSDYIFGFVNQVAREVGRTHPGKYLTIFAYHQNYYPPTREPLEPNVALTFCIHAQLRPVPAMDRAVRGLLDKWDEAAPETPKYLWLYFHRPGRVDPPFFPGFMARQMVEQMRDYHRRGFRGIFAETGSMRDEQGNRPRAPIISMLELYLTYRLADDPELDGHAMIDEFFRLFYGSAGEAMQALYEAIEQVYCDPDNYRFNPDRYFGYQAAAIAWGRLGTAERMDRFAGLMEAAKAAAVTDMEKKRVALFERSVWDRMKEGRALYEKAISTEPLAAGPAAAPPQD